MKVYVADTNILLRFLLRDIPKQAAEAKKSLEEAKEQKIRIVVHPITIFEVDFALEKEYKLHKKDAVSHLKSILSMSYLDILERELLLVALDIYAQKNVDFVDAFLFTYAEFVGSEVLSFDKDFKKIG